MDTPTRLRPEDLKRLARRDESAELERLIDAGASAIETDEVLVNPLSVCAREGALECVRVLIARGAYLDAGDPAPLVAAIEGGHHHVAAELVKAGADVSGGAHDPDFPAPLVIAVERGDGESVRLLGELGAVRESSAEDLEEAFVAGLALQGSKKVQTLHALAEQVTASPEISLGGSGPLRAVRYLRSAAKKSGDAELAEGAERLQERIQHEKAELEEAQDSLLEDRVGDLFRLLARAPAARARRIAGVAAAEAAKGTGALSRTLLGRGAAANMRDEEGRTALMYAVARGCDLVVESLLQHGASVHARDDDGRTALEFLELPRRVDFPHVDVLESDLRSPRYRGREGTSDVGLRLVNAPRSTTNAAELVDTLRLPELFELLDRLRGKEWKLAAGAAVLADCRVGCWTLLKYLLEVGADVNMRDAAGNTVLINATSAFMIPVDLVRRIVEVGADLTARGYQDRTLASAIRRGWPKGHKCRDYLVTAMRERGVPLE